MTRFRVGAFAMSAHEWRRDAYRFRYLMSVVVVLDDEADKPEVGYFYHHLGMIQHKTLEFDVLP